MLDYLEQPEAYGLLASTGSFANSLPTFVNSPSRAVTAFNSISKS